MNVTVPELTYEQAVAQIAELKAEVEALIQANHRLVTFQRVSRLVGASLSLQQILDAILDQIGQFVCFDSSTLMLVEGDQLRAVAARGFASEYLGLNVYPRSSRNSAWRVVQSRSPLLIDDVRLTTDWESRHGLEKVRAWMGIPLIVKDRVIAVLTLDAHIPNIYTLDDAHLIFALSYQVAIAVENGSLFETVKNQHRQLSKLNDLNQAIASVLDLDTLLQVIIEQLSRMLGSDWCTLWLFDEERRFATAAACYSRFEKQPGYFGLTVDVGPLPILRQLRTSSEPLIIDRETANLPGAILSDEAEPLPLLAMPLRYQEKNIGFIVTENTEKREAFLADRVVLAMSAANQAALSIGAAKLFDERQKQAERLRLINEVARQITTMMNVDDLLGILAQVMHERLNYSVVAIFEVERETNKAVLKAITGFSPTWLLPNIYRQRLEAGAIGCAARSGQTLLVKDVREAPEQILITGAGYRSGVVVPVYINDQLTSFIVVVSELVAAFDEQDVWTLETLGQQVAVAVDNARLYRSITQRLDELAILNDAGRAFISTLDLDEILAIIAERVCAALTAEFGYILLIDEAQRETSFAAAAGPDTSRLRGQTIALAGTTIGQVVPAGRAQLLNKPAAFPDFFAELDRYVEAVTRSLMIVPLKHKEKTLGALIVTNKQHGTFNDNNLNLLTAFGQLASGAIENARLFRKVQQYSQDLEEAVAARTQHLRTVNETSRAISNLVAMDDLFGQVTRLISQLFNQARVGLGLRTGHCLIFQKIYDGDFKASLVPLHHRLRIEPDHFLGQVILTGEAVFIEAIDTVRLYGLPTEPEAESTALVVPLTIGGKTTGLIVVQSRSGFDSQQKGLETLQALASQVAVAMENTRLLQKTREMTIIQERARLARDMHDGVAQNLAYLLVQVDRCLAMAENRSDRLEAELEHMGGVLEQNIEELRRHIFDLRPVDLQGRTIFQVMAQVLREFGEQLSIETNYCQLGAEVELSSIVEAGLYRVFQEALSNIRRHAHCTRIEIRLETRLDKSLTLHIEDNGQGFDVRRLEVNPLQRHGLGLVSMEERIQVLGGTLLIDSRPGEGTTIQIDLPDLTHLEEKF